MSIITGNSPPVSGVGRIFLLLPGKTLKKYDEPEKFNL